MLKKRISLFVPLLALIALVIVPHLAFAQSVSACTGKGGLGASDGIIGIICSLVSILNVLMPALILFATVWFIIGVVQYMMAKDEEAQKTSRSKMIHGIIALFVILSFWGLVKVLQETFGFSKSDNTVNSDVLPTIR